MNENKYKLAIAEILNCDPSLIFLYWKGRVALYTILKAMGVGSGDEVILPGFTCVVVPNAILYTGARPVYIDIDPETYNMNIDNLEKYINKKTKVILCQNTFGLSSNTEKIIEIAKRYNLFTIEDCTHGFGGFYKGKPNGSYCDAAFFSTQWNKPFSTGIGGFAVTNNVELSAKVAKLEQIKIKPGFMDKIILSFLIFFRRHFINDKTQIFLVNIFRFLSRYNFIIGSNQGSELMGTDMPDKYQKDISSVQLNSGLKNIKRLRELNKLRKANAISYSSFLQSKKKNHVPESLFENHIFLKYPLLVRDREEFFRLAQKSGVILGDWFLSSLHPIQGSLNPWGFDNNSCPISCHIAERIVNLPTEIKNNKKVLEFLEANLLQIDSENLTISSLYKQNR